MVLMVALGSKKRTAVRSGTHPVRSPVRSVLPEFAGVLAKKRTSVPLLYVEKDFSLFL